MKKILKLFEYLKTKLYMWVKKPRYKNLYFLDEFIYKYKTKKTGILSRSLDLGCGDYPRNPFDAEKLYGIDMRDDLNGEFEIKKANLAVEKIPYPDNFFEYVTAFDFVEHIPRNNYLDGQPQNPFINLMNEIYRVLKPNGIFLHKTPSYPSDHLFQDPTHVNFITENTFPYYFCQPKNWAKNLGYGFNGDFSLIDQRWNHKIWIIGLMRAKK